ncbi:SDR family NAD(P)-dependent oxidoreductase [Kutzneria sp. 744]|uniref:SDR family NAD(P)-dependent oxidoreductase n=1 Tax=Kutzneria sp. (strain 744) TaxID=345341 RepID=UPI0003EED2D0|nr:SDR family NAD(P)-dependent oxidoreductase [Kutzneria sp. 744]EWM18080.1 3-oxoacyl-[acyl carrier protein] reductase [Kutzneria sp. 744]
MDLHGRRALVTGGTGSIGRAIAARLAGAGATVVITGRDERRGEEVIAGIRANGGKVDFARADLASGGPAVRELADRAGDIDILVNNAAANIHGAIIPVDGGLTAV